MYLNYKQLPELAGLEPEIAKQRFEMAKRLIVKKYRIRFGIVTGLCAVIGRSIFGHMGFAVGIGLAVGIGGYLLNGKLREELKHMQSA
jgi:hypothetical protein